MRNDQGQNGLAWNVSLQGLRRTPKGRIVATTKGKKTGGKLKGSAEQRPVWEAHQAPSRKKKRLMQ